MKVYIAVVSSATQHVGSLNSIYELKRLDGDEIFIEYSSRGDVAREAHLETFLGRKEFDAILPLDADQRHPRDMLERLRAHDLDMVCAHYYRRQTNPVQSLCYELTGDGTWPFLPLLDPPTEGLHEIAITGLGCVLIKRQVVDAVAGMLPPGQSPFAIGTLPDLAKDWDNWGSDFRFFILARRAGYRLWLDASLESLHATTLWLGHKSARKLIDYTKWANAAHDLLLKRLELHGVSIEAFKQRKRVLEARRKGLIAEYEAEKAGAAELEKLEQLSIAVYQIDGRLLECDAWIEFETKYPKVKAAEHLPTTANTPDMGASEIGGTGEERIAMHRENAVDLIGELPDVTSDGRR